MEQLLEYKGCTLPVAKKADLEQLCGELTYQPYTALQPEAVTPPISVQPADPETTGKNSGTLDTDPSASKTDLQASDLETVVESPTTPDSPRVPAKEYPKRDRPVYTLSTTTLNCDLMLVQYLIPSILGVMYCLCFCVSHP